MPYDQPDPREKLKRPFEELYPGAAKPTFTSRGRPTSDLIRLFSQFQPQQPQEFSNPQPPKERPRLPVIVQFAPEFTDYDPEQAQQLIETGQFIGLDDTSIRKLIFRHPSVFIAAVSQKILDLVLFPYRAAWSALTYQERNAMPWLGAAVEWGITSTELYQNGHQLPDDHPMKYLILTNARQMSEWESQHKLVHWYFRDSKPLDQLLHLPVPIASDGWPAGQLDQNGDPLNPEVLYADTYLFCQRRLTKQSPWLQNQIKKTALEALKTGRVSLIQSS